MLLMGWYKALLLFLWITPHLLFGVVAVILCKRRLYRKFPCFLAYILYEIAQCLLMFAVYSVWGLTSKPYLYGYCATLLLSIALRFGVIDEVAKDLLRESKFLNVSARSLLQGVTGLLLAVAVLFAVYAPSDNSFDLRLLAGILVINRGAAMVQVGLLLCLLLFSSFQGLYWRRHAFGIALGLAILTSFDLVIYALRAEFTSMTGQAILNLLITGSAFINVSIWIGYLLTPEVEPASLVVFPHGAVIPHDEVEAWNRELQHLLRQ